MFIHVTATIERKRIIRKWHDQYVLLYNGRHEVPINQGFLTTPVVLDSCFVCKLLSSFLAFVDETGHVEHNVQFSFGLRSPPAWESL